MQRFTINGNGGGAANLTASSSNHSLSKKRYDWVDALKALGIFAIYLGHFGKAGGKFYLFVFEYHVPLFFFASGLFAASSKAKSIWEYTRDKFVRIMLPYFAFSMIHLVFTAVQYDYNAHQTTDALWKILWGIRNKTPAAPLWFLPCMFVLSVLFFVLKKLLRYDVLLSLIHISMVPITVCHLSSKLRRSKSKGRPRSLRSRQRVFPFFDPLLSLSKFSAESLKRVLGAPRGKLRKD